MTSESSHRFSHPRPRARRVAALLLLSCCMAAAPTSAASFRLSAGQSWSDITDQPVISPDGAWAVYVEDASVDGAGELWRAPVGGGPPARLSGILPAGVDVFGYHFTPDGSRVVYRANQDDLDATELYSVPIAAPPGSFVKINETLAPGYGLGDFGVSADSTRIVYAVWDKPTHTEFELWVAAIDGSSRLRLVQAAAGTSIEHRVATADLSRVVYVADSVVDERFDAWSVSTAGGTPVKLDGSLALGGDVTGIAVSPAGDRVVYVADQQVDDQFEAYVVPIGGGGAVKVSAPLAAGHDVQGAIFDATRVLYTVVDGATGQVDVWSAAADGSGAVQLSGPMVPGGELTWLGWSADGQRVFWVADQETNDLFMLFSIPTVGGDAVRLALPVTGGGNVLTDPPPALTADGSHVVFVSDRETDGLDELWSVPADGSSGPVKVSHTLAGGSVWSVRGFAIGAGAQRVAYSYQSSACAIGCAIVERLWSAPLLGGDAVRLDNCLALSTNVLDVPVASPTDPRQAFYLADQTSNEQFELYAGDSCLFCDGFEAGTPTARWLLPP